MAAQTTQSARSISRHFSTARVSSAKPGGYRVPAAHKSVGSKRVKPRVPAIGERKILRKRLVLSNTNALEVHGMEDLSSQNMADRNKVGQMLGLNEKLLDQLRAVGAFKRSQNWNMFRRPATLMRRESVELGKTIMHMTGDQAQGLRPQTIRRIITGDRSTGKSLLVLQAMSMAFLQNWVVINIPEGMARMTAWSMVRCLY